MMKNFEQLLALRARELGKSVDQLRHELTSKAASVGPVQKRLHARQAGQLSTPHMAAQMETLTKLAVARGLALEQAIEEGLHTLLQDSNETAKCLEPDEIACLLHQGELAAERMKHVHECAVCQTVIEDARPDLAAASAFARKAAAQAVAEPLAVEITAAK